MKIKNYLFQYEKQHFASYQTTFKKKVRQLKDLNVKVIIYQKKLQKYDFIIFDKFILTRDTKC